MPPRQRAVRAVPVAAAPPVVPVAAAPPVPAQAGAGQAAAAPAAFSDSDDDQDPEALFGIDIEEGKLELAADMSTAFMLPWKTSGDRSGPQQAWQCLQCKATAGSQTFDITAYQTAVQTVAGDEYYIFSCVVHQPEPGSVDNGTASVTTTSLRGFKANNLSQRGRRAGGASQGLGADLRVDLDAQDMILEHNSIRHIRQLSSAEETMLRDHTGSGKGGKAGWFIVPDGVDAADRKPYFNRFLGLDASGQALAAAADSAGEKAWRATQLSNLYAQLMTEGSLKTVTHKDERVAFVEALPKVAAILVAITQAAEAPSDLAWSPTGQDLGIFVPALQTGLPRCVRQHLGQGLMPRPPEVMKRLGGKQPAKGGGSSGGGKTGADGSKRPRPQGRETIPTVAVHDESLTELAEALSSQVLELQSHYEKDMRWQKIYNPDRWTWMLPLPGEWHFSVHVLMALHKLWFRPLVENLIIGLSFSKTIKDTWTSVEVYVYYDRFYQLLISACTDYLRHVVPQQYQQDPRLLLEAVSRNHAAVYLFSFLYDFGFPWLRLRHAIRANDFEVIDVMWPLTFHWFHATGKTNYTCMAVYVTCIRYGMKPELASLWTAMRTASLCGHRGRNVPFDLVLEKMNREAKQLSHSSCKMLAARVDGQFFLPTLSLMHSFAHSGILATAPRMR